MSKPIVKVPASASVPRPWLNWAIAGLVALGAVVRWAAAQDDFWFDEVWSRLAFADACHSVLDVFKQPHDNNHHLITAWMYVCGQQPSWIIDRLPSLVAGIATIVLAALAGRRFGVREAAIAALLAAASFELITYASEARGYALAGFFALAGWLALDSYFTRRGVLANVLFCSCAALGLFAHATSVFFLAGALAWWFAEAVQRRESVVRGLIDLLRLFAVPCAALVVFYLVHLRGLQIGGGPAAEVIATVLQALALVVGRMGNQPLDRAAAAIAVLGMSVGLVVLARQHRPRAVFFLVTILLAPLAMLVFRRPEQLYARYFFVPLVFGLLLLSVSLGWLMRQGHVGRGIAATFLAVYLLANGPLTYGLLRDGRGQYQAALEYIVENSGRGQQVLVQSTHDFETVRMLAFYMPYLPPGKELVYQSNASPATIAPQWAIVWEQKQPYKPVPLIQDAQGRPYVFKRLFPYSGLSGYHWAVYRSRYWEQ